MRRWSDHTVRRWLRESARAVPVGIGTQPLMIALWKVGISPGTIASACCCSARRLIGCPVLVAMVHPLRRFGGCARGTSISSGFRAECGPGDRPRSRRVQQSPARNVELLQVQRGRRGNLAALLSYARRAQRPGKLGPPYFAGGSMRAAFQYCAAPSLTINWTSAVAASEAEPFVVMAAS